MYTYKMLLMAAGPWPRPECGQVGGDRHKSTGANGRGARGLGILLLALLFLVVVVPGARAQATGEASATARTAAPELVWLSLEWHELQVAIASENQRLAGVAAQATALAQAQGQLAGEFAALERELRVRADTLGSTIPVDRIDAVRLDLRLWQSRRDLLAPRLETLRAGLKSLRQLADEVSAGREAQARNRRALAQRLDAINGQLTASSTVVMPVQALTGQIEELHRRLESAREKRAEMLTAAITAGNQQLAAIEKLINGVQQHEQTVRDRWQRSQEAAQLQERHELEAKARIAIETAQRDLAKLNADNEELDRQLKMPIDASDPLASAKHDQRLIRRRGQGARIQALEAGVQHYQALLLQSEERQMISQQEKTLQGTTNPDKLIPGLRERLSERLTRIGAARDLAAKNRDLIASERGQVASQAERLAQSPKGSGGAPETDLLNERAQLLQQHLTALDTAAKSLDSLVAVLDDRRTALATWDQQLHDQVVAEREQSLLARRYYLPRGSLGTLLADTLAALPRRAQRHLVQPFLLMDLGQWANFLAQLFVLILLTVVVRRRFPPVRPDELVSVVAPGSTAAAAPAAEAGSAATAVSAEVPGDGGSSVSRLALHFCAFLRGQTGWLAALLVAILVYFHVPAPTTALTFPIPWLAAVMLYRLCSHLLMPQFLRHPEVERSARHFAFVVAVGLPPAIFLRVLNALPEVGYLLEMAVKIAAIFPVFRLLYLRREAIAAFCALHGGESPGMSQKLFSWLYSFLMVVSLISLFISLAGFDNLALALFVQSSSYFAVFILYVAGKTVANELAQALFAPGHPEQRWVTTSEKWATFYHFLSRKLLRFANWVIVLLALVKVAGVSTGIPFVAGLQAFLRDNAEWIMGRVTHIGIILIGCYAILEVLKTVGESVIEYVHATESLSEGEVQRRASTLVQIIQTTVNVVVFCMASFMILRELGMDITPLLTGAGIVGVAIGFGSQSLVKDFFAGFFILIENQFRVGDVIKVGTLSGVVEKINLKTTVLRDTNGAVHVIPNGEITSVSNLTYTWSRAVVDVEVSYEADVDAAMGQLQKTADSLAGDAKFKADIWGRPEVLGVEALGDSGVTIRVIIKTRPLQQWVVAREFRRRVLIDLGKAGIDIPYPQRTVHIRFDGPLPPLPTGGGKN